MTEDNMTQLPRCQNGTEVRGSLTVEALGVSARGRPEGLRPRKSLAGSHATNHDLRLLIPGTLHDPERLDDPISAITIADRNIPAGSDDRTHLRDGLGS